MTAITNWKTATPIDEDTLPPSQWIDMRDHILAGNYGVMEFDYVNALNSMTTKPTKAVTGTNYKMGTLAFQDSAIPLETFQPQVVPTYFDSTASITLYLLWYATVTTGNVMWRYSITPLGSAETIDPALVWTDLSVVAPPSVASTLGVTSTTISAGTHGIAPQDLIYFGVGRNGTHTSDTMTSSAYLVKAYILYGKDL